MTFTIPLGLLVVLTISVALLVGVTWICAVTGMFEESGWGIERLFLYLAYLVLWAIPSLAGWAVWATWFR